MHDLDRTLLETSDLESDGYEVDGYELVDPELDALEVDMASAEYEADEREMDELELATGLLEVTSEEELERFLGGLVRRAQKVAGRALRSDTGQALVGGLKDAARTAIPRAGAVLGGAVVPGATGTRFGRAVGRQITNWLGLELEGLSPEDQEFEVARAFVRFANDACRRAVAAPPSMPPKQVAKRAVAGAARRLAPALLPVVAASPAGPRRRPRRGAGRWVRRGDAIVIYDA